MKINIVCSDGGGWIYGKFFKKFKEFSKHDILLNAKEKCNIIHNLPYYEFKKTNMLTTGWWSHQETKNFLRDLFISTAQQADFCMSHSKKYASLLASHGIKNVAQIMPGIDFDIYSLRPEKRKGPNNKLVVGFVGRHYQSSNRKNPALLKTISKLPFVDFRISGGKIKESDMPKFYQQLDVVIQTSLIEGGSMAITESLAQGIPVVCYENVGISNEFDCGVLRVPFNRGDVFIKRLEDMWKRKDHIEIWRNKEKMNEMRGQVINFTWENFVYEHDKIFDKLENGL